MKAITNQSGLYRTKDSYYFRKSIPAHAQSILGMTEVKKSFKKDMYRIAKAKTAYMNDYLERLFNKMKAIQPTSEEVNDLIRLHFEKLLLDAEKDIYLDNEVWQEEYPIDAKERHDGKTPMGRIEDLEAELKLQKEQLINQRAKPLYRDLAEELLEWKGYQYYEMSPVAYQLCKGIMESRIEALRMEIALRKGNMHEADIKHPLLKTAINQLFNPDIDAQIRYDGLPHYKPSNGSPALASMIDKYL